MHRPILIAALGATLLLLGCASPGTDPEPSLSQSPPESSTPGNPGPDPRSFVVCKDPRPRVCTREHRPVCAHTMEGGLEERPNGCSACADAGILGHRLGTCR